MIHFPQRPWCTSLLAALALSASMPAAAQSSSIPEFTLGPGPYRLGEQVALRVSIGPNACAPLPGGVEVVPAGGDLLRVQLEMGDACYPDLPAQQRDYLLGPFAPGVYQVNFETCAGLAPPGVDPCGLVSQQTLIVLGAEPAVTLPSGSTFGLALLALALGALGARGLGRR